MRADRVDPRNVGHDLIGRISATFDLIARSPELLGHLEDLVTKERKRRGALVPALATTTEDINLGAEILRRRHREITNPGKPPGAPPA